VRNIASITRASCTPKFSSNSSQTLAATAAVRKPTMMALSVMGNLVQRLRPGVVIVGASEERRRESYTWWATCFRYSSALSERSDSGRVAAQKLSGNGVVEITRAMDSFT
jgi:hypothetical protein